MKHATFRALQTLAAEVGVTLSPFFGNTYHLQQRLNPTSISPVVQTIIFWQRGKIRFETTVIGIITDLPALINHLTDLEVAKQTLLAKCEEYERGEI